MLVYKYRAHQYGFQYIQVIYILLKEKVAVQPFLNIKTNILGLIKNEFFFSLIFKLNSFYPI